MKTYNVYGIGNALVDAEFEVSDDFLTHENIQKGLMTLVDGEAQRVLYDRLVAKFGVKKRAGGVRLPTQCTPSPSLEDRRFTPAR